MKFHTLVFSKIGKAVEKCVVCCSRDWPLRVNTICHSDISSPDKTKVTLKMKVLKVLECYHKV